MIKIQQYSSYVDNKMTGYKNDQNINVTDHRKVNNKRR